MPWTIFNEGYKNVRLVVDLGDGRQEGALFETLVRALKTESQMVAESS